MCLKRRHQDPLNPDCTADSEKTPAQWLSVSSRASLPGFIPALLFPAFWPWTSEHPCFRSLTGQTGIKVPTSLFWGLNKLMQESTENSAGPCNHTTNIIIIGTTILYSKVWSAIMCYHNEVLLWNCHSADLTVLRVLEKTQEKWDVTSSTWLNDKQ